MSGRSFPIWNDVTSCIYKTSKSYGARLTSEVTVRVGTSKSNSEVLCRHYTTRRIHGDWTRFTFGVELAGIEPVIIASKWMHNKTHEWRDTNPEETK